MKQDRVEQLQEVVWQAVHVVLELVPERYTGQLWRISEADQPLEAWKLQEQLAAEIIADLQEENAERWQREWEPRARCPLCKRSSSAPYAEGFKVPAGIEKHLLGMGNAHMCSVLELLRRYRRVREPSMF